MAVYSDLTSEFRVLDYSPTHSQLLIRSMRNKDRSYNIDVIFKAIELVLIPTTFKGLEISLFDDSNPNILKSHFDYELKHGEKIFVLENSKSNEYLLVAMSFGVYHNQLDILETSIGRYDWGNLGENIMWFSK